MPAGDPLIKAKAVYTLYEGSLTEARIQNNLEPLRILPEIVADFLGAASMARPA